MMSDVARALPEGAENISVGGFNRFAGPFYRLPDEGDVPGPCAET